MAGYKNPLTCIAAAISLKADGHKLLGLRQTEEGHYVLELEKVEE